MSAIALVLLVLTDAPANSFDDWQWDRKSPICVLQQQTTPSETIELERTPGNDEVQLRITTSPGPISREGRFHAGMIRVSQAGQSSIDGTVRKKGKRRTFYAVTSDPAFIEEFASASSIEISAAEVTSARIPIRSARLAVEGLRACENHKMSAWGLDPSAWWSLKSHPIPLSQVRDRFSALDYPRDALSAGVEFDSIIRLDVSAAGDVEKCTELNPSAYKGFETASCAVLKGARFQPALDGLGKPVPAPIIYDVVFRIGS
jgi:TonB family protein